MPGAYHSGPGSAIPLWLAPESASLKLETAATLRSQLTTAE